MWDYAWWWGSRASGGFQQPEKTAVCGDNRHKYKPESVFYIIYLLLQVASKRGTLLEILRFLVVSSSFESISSQVGKH